MVGRARVLPAVLGFGFRVLWLARFARRPRPPWLAGGLPALGWFACGRFLALAFPVSMAVRRLEHCSAKRAGHLGWRGLPAKSVFGVVVPLFGVLSALAGAGWLVGLRALPAGSFCQVFHRLAGFRVSGWAFFGLCALARCGSGRAGTFKIGCPCPQAKSGRLAGGGSSARWGRTAQYRSWETARSRLFPPG